LKFVEFETILSILPERYTVYAALLFLSLVLPAVMCPTIAKRTSRSPDNYKGELCQKRGRATGKNTRVRSVKQSERSKPGKNYSKDKEGRSIKAIV
jgi:hypothetical protein